MIVVVADASPLNYLIQIHSQRVLPILYDRVLMPEAVFQELHHSGAPELVRAWMSSIPEWMEVRVIRSPGDPALAGLDPGEREAIQLAQREHAGLLLMDERRGVRLARQKGLEVTGTLGVLIQAARRGLVDIEATLTDLQATDFRCTPELFKQAKERARKVVENS